jgi:hypothetical protein
MLSAVVGSVKKNLSQAKENETFFAVSLGPATPENGARASIQKQENSLCPERLDMTYLGQL